MKLSSLLLFLFFLSSLSLMSQSVYAKEYIQIQCEYSKEYQSNWDDPAKFKLTIQSYNILNDKNAIINYATVLDLQGDMSEIAIGQNDETSNIKYYGRKYNNHFKFPLNLKTLSVDNESEPFAELIISKFPTKTYKGLYGAIIEEFNSVLDISYNDHHGDYIPLLCKRTYWR